MNSILFIILAACMGFLAWRVLKNNPGAFSKENLGRGFFTLGILALLLMLLIVICVKVLKM